MKRTMSLYSVGMRVYRHKESGVALGAIAPRYRTTTSPPPLYSTLT